MNASTTSPAPPQMFPATRWSVVLAATRTPSPESASALETLCRAYWPPLYAYARRCGQSPHDAQDLTQEFFRLLLEKRWLHDADRERGRLRTFLITAFKHFLAKEWRRASAQKRGGPHPAVALDTRLMETLDAADPASRLAPDEAFDRQWALTLLDLALQRLQGEYTTAGRAEEFAALKPCLTADRGALPYAALAAQLGLNPGAARVTVHRFRKRFRELYRQEIAQTLEAGTDVDGELRHLAAALAQG